MKDYTVDDVERYIKTLTLEQDALILEWQKVNKELQAPWEPVDGTYPPDPTPFDG